MGRGANPSVRLRRPAPPLRTETAFQAVPVLRSAYFPQRVHSTLCSKTLDLQVRCAHPTGNFAPKRSFGAFRCCAWLIFRFRTDPPSVRRCSARLIRQAETLELQPRSRPPSKRTALSVGKRSCFRFAALTLRLRTETTLRDVPVLRSAYFLQRVHSTLCSKTLDLQVRFARPTGVFAPERPFGTFRCSGRLILRKEYTVLFAPKRSAFRFASLALRGPSHRNIPSECSGVAHGLFE